MKKYLFVFLLFAVLLTSCSKKTSMSDIYKDEQNMFDQAMQNYDKGKWGKAIDQFQRYIFSYPATKRTEEAQYYLADSYFMKKDWTQAIVEYEYFMLNFRNYNLSKKAGYRLCECYYNISPRYQFDQAVTFKAIEVMNDFLAKYPESEDIAEVDSTLRILLSRIEEKKMHTGNYYLKRKDFTAAEVYFDQVYPDNLLEKWKDFFYYRYGYVEYKLKKYPQSENAFMLVLPEGKYGAKAKHFLNKLKISK